MVIGNGIVAPLTYETIERAEKATGRVVEAMQREKWDIANMTPEEWMEKADKYYQQKK